MAESERNSSETADSKEAVAERRKASERRKPSERRNDDERRLAERRSGRTRRNSEISEHRKVERRINEYPMTDAELEFIQAINDYKQRYSKPFPTWSEILHILVELGYQKTEN